MLQTMTVCRALPNVSAKRSMSSRVIPTTLQRLPRQAAHLGFCFAPLGGAFSNEVAVDPVTLDQILQDAVKESDVAASMDLEVIIGDLGTECALSHGRYPVAIQSWFAIGIDDEDLGSGLLGIVEILCGNWLIVR